MEIWRIYNIKNNFDCFFLRHGVRVVFKKWKILSDILQSFVQITVTLTRLYHILLGHLERFLRSTAATAVARLSIAILSVRPSVRLSVRHTGGSVKNGAR